MLPGWCISFFAQSLHRQYTVTKRVCPLQPTRRNILNALGWLVSDAQPGDSLFFHYSGHGSQVRDYNGGMLKF
jgi:hypothetical protein